MRISDWRSDVFSSDLISGMVIATPMSMKTWLRSGAAASQIVTDGGTTFGHIVTPSLAIPKKNSVKLSQKGLRCRRSEERRVGKECVSTFKSRRSPDH